MITGGPSGPAVRRPDARPARSPAAAWVRGFFYRYGWRAYALPVLSVVTLVAALQPAHVAHRAGTTRSSAPPPITARAPAPATVTATATATATASPSGAAQPGTVALPADRTPCATNASARLILVSVSAQRAWMCQRSTQVYSTLVTTGAVNVGDGTPLGTWHIQDKQTDRYLEGPGYRDFVHYWLPFDGDFGFHDAAWQTMPYGAPGYRSNGSHGCVHLPLPAMSWLFRWVDTGTTVTIQT